MKFETLRIEYPKFIYNNYKIFEEDDKVCVEYDFEIQNLTRFTPRIEILKKNFKFNNINSNKVKNIVFNLGLVEAISYYKATCSSQFLIKCGYLDTYQEKWFKKLFYLGLGEFRYINDINVSEEEFFEFISEGKQLEILPEEDNLDGIIIPVGGGKDSNVTLDLLKEYKQNSLIFRIGKNQVSTQCAEVAGFEDSKVVEVKRTIDKNLIDLNSKGFLNGHTPFSAMVAFLTY